MIIEIDQSGRVEYTSKNTVIADSLGNYVVITAKNKRILQKLYRSAGKPRVFVLQTFSVLLALLIVKSFASENQYILDEEYTGHEKLIQEAVVTYVKKLNMVIKKENIHFKRIGKKSMAHITAYKTYINKITKNTITVKQLLKLLLP